MEPWDVWDTDNSAFNYDKFAIREFRIYDMLYFIFSINQYRSITHL
ncbi:protein of unknown function [Legionella hackeliae]|uniref:Uncharacterized protein n=1 Tax=Legionella hackeliae TaxID=449 RepID=A0A0A8ULP9_LEGHA|nr:protein of unknown function [Legionella hackeliae]